MNSVTQYVIELINEHEDLMRRFFHVAQYSGYQHMAILIENTVHELLEDIYSDAARNLATVALDDVDWTKVAFTFID